MIDLRPLWGASSLDNSASHSEAEAPDVVLAGLAERLGLIWHPLPVPEAAQTAELRELLPPGVALRHGLLPLRVIEPERAGLPRKLELATADPFDMIARQIVAREVPLPVRWTLAPQKRLVTALQDFYGVGADTFEAILKGRDAEDALLDSREDANALDDEDEEDATVVKFMNQILREALSQQATDIHIEPQDDTLRIRYRLDGQLRDVPVPDRIKALQHAVIARVKVMARLDIAEHRLPQDGRLQLSLGPGQSIDVRVACIPSVEGETISLRLLGQEKFTLDRLRLEPDMRREFETLLTRPNGIVLVTGPTGCGKSTSLYTFLSALNVTKRRIVTIEDPVENKLRGVVQIAVQPEIGLTFASGLRSILRGDPNVVMVGEIRDLETAEIAIRAALTGHLVFSTLHTNDAVGGISRLIDMGVEPFLVASSVRAFIAQRLVRQLCPDCREPEPLIAERMRLLDRDFIVPPGARVYHAREGGCEACRHTGYRGRLAIYELCRVTTHLGEEIGKKASARELGKIAREEGFRPMRLYGITKILQGLTTIEEVIAVTAEE